MITVKIDILMVIFSLCSRVDIIEMCGTRMVIFWQFCAVYLGDELAFFVEAEVMFSGLWDDVDFAVGTDWRQFDIGCNRK